MSIEKRKRIGLILAGGSGTRLWPLSTDARPKQFLALCGRSETLLRATADRLVPLCDGGLFAVAAPAWRRAIESEELGAPVAKVIEEPQPRGTAPAIALAIAELSRTGASDDDVVFVCPSDHLIADGAAFASAVDVAFREAERGAIATLGIVPDRAETGFGYIKTRGSGDALDVDSFVEKPDAERAARYVASGDYLWNGGCFCFAIGVMREAFARCFPESAKIASRDRDESIAAFLSCPKISIDHAVMEKSDNIRCVPLDAGWSDVGSWSSVFERSQRDSEGCAITGRARLFGANDLLVVNTTGRLICCVDMQDIAIIETDDATFVAPLASSQKLTEIVRALKEEGLA